MFKKQNGDLCNFSCHTKNKCSWYFGMTGMKMTNATTGICHRRTHVSKDRAFLPFIYLPALPKGNLTCIFTNYLPSVCHKCVNLIVFKQLLPQSPIRIAILGLKIVLYFISLVFSILFSPRFGPSTVKGPIVCIESCSTFVLMQSVLILV